MKKHIFAIIISLTAMMLPIMTVPVMAAAPDVFGACAHGAANTDVCKDARAQNKTTTNPAIKELKVAINLLSVIVGVAAVIIAIVSGIRIITSQGDTNSYTQARNGLIYAAIGVVIVALAQSIVVLVLSKA